MWILEATGNVCACWQECFSLFFSRTRQEERGSLYYLQNCILLRPQQAVAEDLVGGEKIWNRGKKKTKNEIFSILLPVQYQNEPRNNNLAEE
jgi:hypothetical protein